MEVDIPSSARPPRPLLPAFVSGVYVPMSDHIGNSGERIASALEVGDIRPSKIVRGEVWRPLQELLRARASNPVGSTGREIKAAMRRALNKGVLYCKCNFLLFTMLLRSLAERLLPFLEFYLDSLRLQRCNLHCP